LPREVFVAGQVLTAAELNVVSDQSVMVFAGTASRGSAIPSPTEGMVTYLSDSDEVEVYTTSWGAIAGGKILQVISTTKTDTFTASVAGGAESGDITGLTASITPSSTANNILITGFVFTDKYHTQGFSIYRDATKIGQGDAASNRTRIHSATSREGATNNPTSGAMNFLDSPSSTSSVTYSVRLHNGDSGTQTLYVNRSQADTDSAPFARGVSTITLMEVAG